MKNKGTRLMVAKIMDKSDFRILLALRDAEKLSSASGMHVSADAVEVMLAMSRDITQFENREQDTPHGKVVGTRQDSQYCDFYFVRSGDGYHTPTITLSEDNIAEILDFVSDATTHLNVLPDSDDEEVWKNAGHMTGIGIN